MKMHYFVFKIILFKYIWHREINCIHLKCATWCFCGYVYIVMEKEMAAHSSILAWRVPWTGEPGRLQSMGLPRVGHDWTTKNNVHCEGFPDDSVAKNPPTYAGDAGNEGSIPWLGRYPGEENGNPLQYSCLENLMDRGAWRAGLWGHNESNTT